MKKYQKGFAAILVIGVVVVVGAVLFLISKNFGVNNLNLTVNSSPTPISIPIGIKGWKTYKSNSNAFSFQYPAEFEPAKNEEFVGENVDFFKSEEMQDQSFGDHVGNEFFGFSFTEDDMTLEQLKKDYFSDATDVLIDSKPAIKNHKNMNSYTVKSSPNLTLSLHFRSGITQSVVDQILSTFKFTN